MKLALLLLLLANLALFAWQQGAFGPAAEAGREPQRLARQVAAEKIRVLSPEQVAALRGGSKAASSVSVSEWPRQAGAMPAACNSARNSRWL